MRDMGSVKAEAGRPLASKGCKICHEGATMVLFITGLCPRTCWYCPLSSTRKDHDVTYANERIVSSPEEAVETALLMSALGTGVTGGEPLVRLDRVLDYCSHIKNELGKQHHIHLYTGFAPDRDALVAMRGLIDELRMHPPADIWPEIGRSAYSVAAVEAKKLGFSIGIEVPALPGLDHLKAALPVLDFLNINELEWGETNASEMRRRGLDLEDSLHNAVRGAANWAAEICRDEKVHWCASGFKDSVQLRKRLIRIAKNTARPFDEVTTDGTVIYGILQTHGVRVALPPEFRLGTFERHDDHIEMDWQLLLACRDRLPGEKSIVERYPDRGIIVEVTPL